MVTLLSAEGCEIQQTIAVGDGANDPCLLFAHLRLLSSLYVAWGLHFMTCSMCIHSIVRTFPCCMPPDSASPFVRNPRHTARVTKPLDPLRG